MPVTATTLKVAVISGNTHRPSKSKALAEQILRSVQSNISIKPQLFDILDAGPGLGAAFTRAELTPEAAQLVDAIEAADALIVVAPVYKGSYSGLFKHLFDFIEPAALIDRPVLIGATGGGHRHALVVEHQLRPLFAFFTALTVPTAIYATDSDFSNGEVVEPLVLDRIAAAAGQFAAILEKRAPRALSAAA
ncbi:MAG: FMN reductase [Methylocella sp.]